MSKSVTAVNDTSFESEVLKASGLVLVDFWAEWCGPCKMISPALDDLSNEMQGQVKIAKVNIDDNPVTPNAYGVRSIPTLMLVRNGKVLDTKVGAFPKSQIKAWIESVL